jgi:DNA topoisomerase-3
MELAVKNYVKRTYYEIKYKDNNGHVYTSINGEKNRKENADELDLNQFNTDIPTNIQTERKTTPPSKLFVLSSLSPYITKYGYTSKQVTDCYQKMYEDQILEYPRTDDNTITSEQFILLKNNIYKIADVVGVDQKLLTHTNPRKAFISESASHGANRPGNKIPASLAELNKYDPKGCDGLSALLYEVLAKKALSIFAEDYVFDRVTAELAEHDDYKTAFSIPVEENWKAVFNFDNDKEKKDETILPVGNKADAFIYEGANTKPPAPTDKILMKWLEKNNLGTGATRVSTFSSITTGKNALLSSKKGKLATTDSGKIAAIMANKTYIGDVKTTVVMQDLMNKISKGTGDRFAFMDWAVKYVEKDLSLIGNNVPLLEGIVNKGEPPAQKEFETVLVNGREMPFNRTWGVHRFTDEELEKLKNKEEIQFETQTSKYPGVIFIATGKLAKYTLNEQCRFGFKLNEKNGYVRKEPIPFKEKVDLVMKDKTVRINKEWNGHWFTDEELVKLAAGEYIEFETVNKDGKRYIAKGSIKRQTCNGVKFWGFGLDFKEK